MGNGEKQQDAFLQAVGNKHLLGAMKLQQENLKIEQAMLEDKKLLAYLDNEALRMRLELANLLVENPQIVGAMEIAGQAPQQTGIQEPTIETEGDFQAEEPANIPENATFQEEPEEGNFSSSENQQEQV